ncbi:MAG: RNA polymerase Rpb4 family protein [Candidatus Thermoplasmatota archaeon]
MTPDDINKYVSLAEVKAILKKIESERKDLIYEQRIALEHAEKFVQLSVKQTKDLIKELRSLGKIEEVHAYKIADLLPKTVEDVKAIFAKDRYTPNEAECKKIIDIVKKYISEA